MHYCTWFLVLLVAATGAGDCHEDTAMNMRLKVAVILEQTNIAATAARGRELRIQNKNCSHGNPNLWESVKLQTTAAAFALGA